MIDQATVDRILDAAQIVDVVSDFVTLRKRGVNYVGLCPFHSEKTPSFSVTPSKQMYYCFGCHQGGSVFTFIQQMENCEFIMLTPQGETFNQKISKELSKKEQIILLLD